MMFEFLVIITVVLCGYITWPNWRSKASSPDVISEMEKLSRELRATKDDLKAKDTELQAERQQVQAKETELQAKDSKLKSHETTISVLEKKVGKVEHEKDQGMETVLEVLFKHRDSIEATADFKYKCQYDEPMSDLHTRLRDVEEAYLAKCRALEAVTAEYSQVVAFASSNGTIPPPDEPTLARILMEYQEE
ncbi:hypothetical protein IWQ62_004439, partial [Dispira parvispora]